MERPRKFYAHIQLCVCSRLYTHVYTHTYMHILYTVHTQCLQINEAGHFINRLLDVLADRKAKKGLSGHVLINGRRQPRNFKCASAYVVQVSSP